MLDVNNVSPDVLLDPNLGVVGNCAFDATTLLHDVAAVLVAATCC